ncbi:substrate-binding periplasmic protein [Halopseudomonas salegens]|uniref:Amino acid ABC transporter substrate-binding protein, PAAT family n=1 Tax=Halopseudomonas salegens TaxID=1434072 RepID=A0A1H2FC82_9GAMM|nr:transporter substrate-binding domain-containing protein [Halopseudomonas salegens]SDU04939.1 amino acid ABC transporter substrate-binding protein, PAAT family [Halopseudomonas salegens]
MSRWLLLCCLLTLPLQASELARLNFITEEYPPYNYISGQQLKGSSVDILDAILQHNGQQLDRAAVRVLPWARGYDTTLEYPNTVLFSTTRTRTRDGMFEWVGPLAAGRVVLLARKDKDLQLNSLADLKASDYSVVALREDIGAQVLLEGGIPESQLRIAVSNVSAMNMLVMDRVDLWAYGEDVAQWLLKENGHDLAQFESVLLLTEDPLYFAINRDTDAELIQVMQDTLDQLRTEGTLPQID